MQILYQEPNIRLFYHVATQQAQMFTMPLQAKQKLNIMNSFATVLKTQAARAY